MYTLLRKGKLLWFVDCASWTLWVCAFLRFLVLLPLVGRRFLPAGMADFFHIVCILPLIELTVVKAVRGIWTQGALNGMLAPLNALRMIWLCYGVIFQYPKIAKHILYSILIIAWCVSYIIHFGYYGFRVKMRTTPYWLFWLKHHYLFVTLPMLMVAEMVLLFLLLKFVDEGSYYGYALKAVLLSYIPLGYFIWGWLIDRRYQKFTLVVAKKKYYARQEAQKKSQGADHLSVPLGNLSQLSVATSNSAREPSPVRFNDSNK